MLKDLRANPPAVHLNKLKPGLPPVIATLSFSPARDLPCDLPTHVVVAYNRTNSSTLFAYATYSPILVASCASVTPKIAEQYVSGFSGVNSHLKDKRNIQVPTYLVEVPEPACFAPLHDWLFSHNSVELIKMLFSTRMSSFNGELAIPALPSGHIRLLGASAQPDARDLARNSLYNVMVENFNIDAFVLMLNRLRAVKVNAVAMQINSEDLHLTLDALYDVAYKACKAIAAKQPQSIGKSSSARGQYHAMSKGYGY